MLLWPLLTSTGLRCAEEQLSCVYARCLRLHHNACRHEAALGHDAQHGGKTGRTRSCKGC